MKRNLSSSCFTLNPFPTLPDDRLRNEQRQQTYNNKTNPEINIFENKSGILAHVKNHIKLEEENHHHLVELLSESEM